MNLSTEKHGLKGLRTKLYRVGLGEDFLTKLRAVGLQQRDQLVLTIGFASGWTC